MSYEHTQYGYLFVAIEVVVLIVLAASAYSAAGAGSWPSLVVIGACGLLIVVSAFIFSSMTIKVGADRVNWSLGFGSFQRVVYFADITACETRKLSPLAGLGIRTNDFKSWLVTIGAGKAVAMKLKNGTSLLLGSDDADHLCTAINEARAKL